MAPDSAELDTDSGFFQILAQTETPPEKLQRRLTKPVVVRTEAEDEDTEQKIINEGTWYSLIRLSSG
jgi:hypothetical protein